MTCDFDFADFHAHIDQYGDDALEDVTAKIISKKILTVTASTDIESWRRNVEIAARAPELILPTFGVHPSFCGKIRGEDIEPYLAESRIIGEIGLDFFWERKVPREEQERYFLLCLDHCHRNGKAAVIHTKGAERRVADILRDFPAARPIIHWYDGDDDVYKTFLDRGYPQTFGCELRRSERIARLLRMTPPELILAETDNPTGEPWLGGTDNTPALIERVVKDIAAARSTTPAETSALIRENTLRALS